MEVSLTTVTENVTENVILKAAHNMNLEEIFFTSTVSIKLHFT